MKIEDIKDLLEEIGLNEDGYGYIDCTTATEYTDNNQYERIVATLKQNIELQQANEGLTKKLEEVEKQGMESLLQIEAAHKALKENTDIANRLLEGISKYIKDAHLKKDKNIKIGDYTFDGKAIRIGDYIFKNDGSFLYEPIKEIEPIELKIKITENSDNEKECPICGNPLGKYPAISRDDNKTEICSNCGTLEAIAAFEEAVKDEKTNEKDI